MTKRTASLVLSGDAAADELLSQEPLALLIGMVLDQQVPLEWAFHSPLELKDRLGGHLDAAEMAEMDPDELRALFAKPPALHRFPGSMGGRVQELCRVLVERNGDPVARAELSRTRLTEGDRLELVRAVAGG